ncbi:MAG TPA: divalent-cation tolerance protein CutA [Caulobacter sp.]|nr:divalent-cation tolerance protein CutA [Caulobacter sp.]
MKRSDRKPAGLILYTTWPSAETAAAAARELVEAGLAACANLLPAGRSIYLWEGRLEDQAETVLLLKTPASLGKSLRARLEVIHPYETPCILALPVAAEASATSFLLWMEEVAQQRKTGAFIGPQSGEKP